MTRADAWGWISVLILVFFVFATILSSIASWYFKKELAKRQEERRAKLAQRTKGSKKKDASAVMAADIDGVLNSSTDTVEQAPKKRSKKRGKKDSGLERIVNCFSLQ